jgi:hypothetical protein
LPLKASSNNRYLVDQNNNPVQLIGDSAQSLIVNISTTDAATYFSTRKSQGFNAAWTVILTSPHCGGRADGSTYDGILPLTGADLSSLQGNIDSPNEAFFQRVDAMVALAAQNGITLLLDPYDSGGLSNFASNSGNANCFAFGQYLGNRYKNSRNVIWITGDDFQVWSSNSAENAAVAQIMAGIASVDRNHLQTDELNYFVSGSHDDSVMMAYTTLASSYTYYSTYAEDLKEYNASPTTPVFLVEANYEGGNNTGQDLGDPPTLRRQEYWTMTSGCTGQLFGAHGVRHFDPGWQQALDSVCTTQYGYMASFFNSIRWWTMVPDQAHTVVTAGYGVPNPNNYPINDDYVTTSASPDGTLAVSYVPNGQTLTVNLAAFSGPVTLRWFDPTNNTFTTITGSPFPNSGSIVTAASGNNAEGTRDWVLVMKTR